MVNIRKLCDNIFTRNGILQHKQRNDDAYFKAVTEMSAELRNRKMYHISTESHDGLRLHGHLRNADEPKRIILALHGYASTFDRDFALVADRLNDTGCTVLFAEHRAHGKSEGGYTSMGINERYDCIKWLEFINRNISDKLPVYIYGMSMGAATALMAAGKPMSANVHGIIADSPFISPIDAITHFFTKKAGDRISVATITERLDRMLMKRFGFSLYDYSVREALKSVSRPVLLLHGAKDTVNPISMTQEIFDSCNSEKTLTVFSNSKHLRGCFDEKDRYFNALDKFFAENDSRTFSEEIHLNYPEKTMFQMVKDAAARLPQDPAYNFEGKKTTYGKMMRKIEKTAKAFIKLGIKKGDTVTLCMPNTPQAVDSLYALNSIGAVVSFIHPLSAEKEIAYYLSLSKSKAIVVPDLFYENVVNAMNDVKHNVKIVVARIQDELTPVLYAAYTIKKGKDYLSFPDKRGGILWKDFIKDGEAVSSLPEAPYEKDRTAVILYSGGTTGSAKGICLTDLNFNALAMQARISMECEFSRGLKNLSAMPMFHGFGLGIGIHTVLINNACCVLLAQFNTKTYAKAMLKRKPNFIAGVPTIFKMLVECDELKNADLSFLKGMFVGGDSMPADLKRKVDSFLKSHGTDIQVREGYGLTECVTASCLTPKDTYKEGSIGRPFPDMVYKAVIPGTEKEVPAGEDGELIISGPTVMQGYLDNEEETAVVLRTHSDGITWLHTGDMGSIDEDGYVSFRQRIKRMIITSGYNVYPSQVEKAIESHPDVDYCCVIGVKDPYRMERIKAYIVTNEGIDGNDSLAESIKDHCRKQIAGYAIPKEVEFRKELPRTLVGKVAYRKLEDE
ncbi:MAG: alpha/beta fold hydrolase [Clostridia bacterium]|nr:alpha/beta fold hydrolase [Clostridia bacterium]